MKILLIIMLFSYYLKSEWKEVLYRSGDIFISIHCPDSNNCFFLTNAVGTKDNSETLIFKSSNQGRDWKEIYRYNPLIDEPRFLFGPKCASVPNAKDYFISYFENGSLKVSNDSAKTFRTIDLGTPREVLWIDMYDENVGMAFTPINNYITYDGWKTWEEHDDFYKVSDPENMVFAPREPEFQSKDILYLLTANTTNKSRGSCFTTFDMQTKKSSYNNIDSMEYEAGKVPFIQDFCVIDINTIIAVGEVSSTFGQTSYNLVYKSTDAGKTWVKKHEKWDGLPIGYAGGLQKVSFYDDKNGVAVGARGSILLTNDGGETWKYEDIPKSMEDSPTMKVEWAGRTPIIGTFKGGLYYYEGDYFKFDPVSQYKITGQITTEKAEPVAGVEIVYKHSSKPSETYSVLTDDTGNYIIDNVPDNSYLQINPKIEYFKSKYNPSFVDYSLTKDTIIDFTQITAEEFYDISGKVIEEEVGVKRIPLHLYTSYGNKTTYTDDGGNYKFENVPKDDIYLINNASNLGYQFYKPYGYEFNLQNDTSGIDFEIVREKDIYKRVIGRVTLAGEGVANTKVKTFGMNGSPDYVLTDENGYYITDFIYGEVADVNLEDIDTLKYTYTPKLYSLQAHNYPDEYENIDFELSTVTSVDEESSEPLIYPNPANESITISGIGKSKVEIYNILGQKVIEQDIFGKSEINISPLNGGIYIIKLTQGKETYVDRVIITD